MSKKSENFLNGMWTIGTGVQSYINGTILKWITDTNFSTEYVKSDLGSYFTVDEIVYKDESREKFTFYKSERSDSFSKTTIRQVVTILQICGILRVESEKNNNWVFTLNKEFQKELKNEYLSRWEFRIQKYACNKVVKYLNNYINIIDEYNRYKEDDLSEIDDENKEIGFYEYLMKNLSESFIEIFTSTDSNWMNSMIAAIASNLQNDFGSEDFNLIKNHLNADVIKAVPYWKDFCNYIFQDQDKLVLKSMIDRFITVLGLKQKLRTQEELHAAYTEKEIDSWYTTHNHYESIPSSLESIKENKIFYSSVCNLHYLLRFSTIQNKIHLPLYQRNYSWDERLLDILFEDIFELSQNLNKKHFLGSITFSQKNNDLNIVDGQQRTISLILISYALYKLILLYNKNNLDKIAIPDIFLEMFYKHISWFKNNPDYKESESYQYLEDLFSSNVQKITEIFPAKNKKEFKYKIKNNLDYIWGLLNGRLTNKKSIEDFLQAFIENLYFNILFVSNEYEDKIFEKMNLLSQRLSNIDLINSLIYKLWDTNKHKESVKTFRNHVSKHFYKSTNATLEDKKKIDLFADFISYKYNIDGSNQKNSDYKSYFVIKQFIEQVFEKHKNDYDKFLKAISKEVWIFHFILLENNKELDKLLDKNKHKFNELINKDHITLLKTIFPFVHLTKVSDTTVLFLVVYSILKKFEILNFEGFDRSQNAKKFNEAIKWLFEIERFQLIWKTSHFEGQSIRNVVKGWAIKILNNEITTIDELRTELYNWIDQNKTIDEIVFDFSNNIESKLSEDSRKKANVNKNNIVLMRRIEFFLMNDFENFPEAQYLKNTNAEHFIWLFSDKSSWEHYYPRNIQEKDKDHEIEEADKETGIINSLGNGFILNMTGNIQTSNNKPEDKYDKYRAESNQKSFDGKYLSIEKADTKQLDNLKELLTQRTNEIKKEIKLFALDKKWTKEKIENRNKELIATIKDIYSVKKDK
ncbi:DUF262 domain-containing protein [Mycoplasmopsis glycophila]|uniref:Protein of uncharacterized function DUF262 n=1 Tax=Mycoplasmopsis glycophila TaxID=171285 RepID=A0A449AUD3_9BACT|nr:DUF262 domain-containing protein [Mycoplasmopsis glycophila]VEU70088.1 Protein of uncharacterised function DUF262 [Mycoplasmopsis glycophila]